MKIYLVWGFLGSGKTTLINNLLSQPAMQGKKIVILENESGTASVDGEMLRTNQYTVVDLKGGCMCCTFRMKLVEILSEIEAQYNPDAVFIESSGLASLEDIQNIPGLIIAGVLTTLDVVQYDFLMRLNPNFYKRQFYCSSVIFLTKTSMVSQAKVDSVTAELLSYQPSLQIIADYTELKTDEWQKVWTSIHKDRKIFLPAMYKQELPSFSCETMTIESPLDEEFFLVYFSQLNKLFGSGIIRAKGIIKVCGEKWVKFDFVDNIVSTIELSGYKGSAKGFLSVWWDTRNTLSPVVWLSYFLNATQLECKISDITLTDEVLYQYLGFDQSNLGLQVDNIIEVLKKEALAICSPQVGVRFVSGKKLDKNHLKACGTTLEPSFIITKALEKADFYVLMLSTVGSELDEWIEQKRTGGDVMEAYVADAIGSSLAEEIVAYGQKSVEELLKKWNLKLSNAYSPGYCDWNVSEQKLFFSMLPQNFCNVELTDSCLMLPIKSVSSLLGAGSGIEKKAYGCAICKNKNCYKRKL